METCVTSSYVGTDATHLATLSDLSPGFSILSHQIAVVEEQPRLQQQALSQELCSYQNYAAASSTVAFQQQPIAVASNTTTKTRDLSLTRRPLVNSVSGEFCSSTTGTKGSQSKNKRDSQKESESKKSESDLEEESLKELSESLLSPSSRVEEEEEESQSFSFSQSTEDSGLGQSYSALSMTMSASGAVPAAVTTSNTQHPNGMVEGGGRPVSYAGSTGDEADDLLDLDNFEEDEESWLYGSKKSGGDTTDVMSWIRVAAHSLEPKARHSLIQKLDAIAKKTSAPQNSLPHTQSNPSNQQNQPHSSDLQAALEHFDRNLISEEVFGVTEDEGSHESSVPSLQGCAPRFETFNQRPSRMMKDHVGSKRHDRSRDGEGNIPGTDSGTFVLGPKRKSDDSGTVLIDEGCFPNSEGLIDLDSDFPLIANETDGVLSPGIPYYPPGLVGVQEKVALQNSGTFKINRPPARKSVTVMSPPLSELNTPDFVMAEERMLGHPCFPEPLFLTQNFGPNSNFLGKPIEMQETELDIRTAGIQSQDISRNTNGTSNTLLSPHNVLQRETSRESTGSPAGVNSATLPRGSKESSPRLEIHPELHPNLQDIQLLASMQEEDLRKCLEKMNMQRRRRTSSSTSANNPPPDGGDNKSATRTQRQLSQGNERVMAALNQSHNAQEFFQQTQATPIISQRTPKPYFHTQTPIQKAQLRENKEKFQTFKKPGPPAPGAPVVKSSGYGAPRTPRSNISRHNVPPVQRGVGGGRLLGNERRFTGPSEQQVTQDVHSQGTPSSHSQQLLVAGISSQQAMSLQKSLPNLLTSQSAEFSVANETESPESRSERGSYANIPNVLSPATSNLQMGDSKPESKRSMLRQPTPRGARSGIPMPKSTGIPRPNTGGNRAKSPGGKRGPHAINRISEASVVNKPSEVRNTRRGSPPSSSEHFVAEENTDWSEGCF